jgi:8-oxo-dGTP diphosphatase
MKDRKDNKDKRAPILAAGGIVLRGDRKPQIAVVQLRKLSAWVLPKGKLAASESAIAAARREVLEETGHRVSIHEFLGTLAYEAGGRPKVVQFWRMQAIGAPVRELMRDVKAVQWLALDDAIAQLTHAREQAFLEHVGPLALKSAERSARRAVVAARPARRSLIERVRPSIDVEPPAPFDIAAYSATHWAMDAAPNLAADAAPIGGPDTAEAAEPDIGAAARLPAAPAANFAAPELRPGRLGNADEPEPAGGRNLIEKTWVWFRQTTLPHRPRRD